MASYELQVKWIARSGNSLGGKDWDAFMEEQRAALTTMAGESWRLVSAVPADHMGSFGTTLGGVMLYFERAREE